MDNVRQTTNKLLELIDNGLVDDKMLAEDILSYMSEDDVKDFAESSEYLSEDEISDPYAVRAYTNAMYSLVDQGLLDNRQLVRNLLTYMSEDDVEDFANSNEYNEYWDED